MKYNRILKIGMMIVVPLSLLSQRMAMMVVWSTAVRYRFRDTRFSI
jgi:hypothetical protein